MSWKFERVGPEWADFKENVRWPRSLSDVTHAYVNVFVEGFRRMPYTLGHIAAFSPLAWLVWSLT